MKKIKLVYDIIIIIITGIAKLNREYKKDKRARAGLNDKGGF